jgi:hypothetical protein
MENRMSLDGLLGDCRTDPAVGTDLSDPVLDAVKAGIAARKHEDAERDAAEVDGILLDTLERRYAAKILELELR